jgi:hypothetical protein
MTATLLLAGLSAGRRVVACSNPDFVDWTTRSWDKWLRAERAPAQSVRHRLLVVAALTCIEDLSLHAGVIQLLASPA